MSRFEHHSVGSRVNLHQQTVEVCSYSCRTVEISDISRPLFFDVWNINQTKRENVTEIG